MEKSQRIKIHKLDYKFSKDFEYTGIPGRIVPYLEIKLRQFQSCGSGLSDLKPNSWTKSRYKSQEFSSLLLAVTSIALPSDFYFFKLTQPLTVSTVNCTVKKKGGKPDRKPYPLPYDLKISIQKPQI
jgi:hypothetical protein